jgi:ATP-dependent RNA helicase DHX8/PRP22
LPDVDCETGLLPKEENEEEYTEIEVVEDKPSFLQSDGFVLHDLRPVRIVKKPDSFLA